MSLLVISKFLGLFLNTFTADDKYSLGYIEKLPQPTQMQLSRKQKTFSGFFGAFLKSKLDFKNFYFPYYEENTCLCQ